MRSKINDRREDPVTGSWTDETIVHPLKQVANDMTILVVFAGFGVLVGAISAIQIIRNRFKG